MADAFLRFLCVVVTVAVLVEQAASVDTAVLVVMLACDGVVVVSCDMVPMLGLSVLMSVGGRGGVFMFLREHVIG